VSHKRENPKPGRESEVFRNRLQFWLRCGNLDSAIYQDKQSIAQNTVYLAIASQKHCEIDPGLWLSFKKANQFLFYQERITVPPSNRLDLHNLYGDVHGNAEYLPLAAKGHAGKRGVVTLKEINGRIK
jgi:hypothetical protein